MLLIFIALFYLLIIGLIVFKTKKSIYLFLAILPIQPLLKTLIDNNLELSNIENILLYGWKEFFICSLFLFLVVKILATKEKIMINSTDYLIGLIFMLILFSFILFGSDINQLIFGIKYSSLFLLLYISTRFVNLNKKETINLIRFFFLTVVIVLILSLIQIILPTNTLAQIGYTNFNDWQPNLGLQAFQEAGSFNRVFGSLSGPNQLGIYLVFTLLTFLGLNRTNILDFKIDIKSFFLILGILLIILTFSRSAWLALIVGLIIYYYLNKENYSLKIRRIISIGFILILLISSLLVFTDNGILLRHTDQTRINQLGQSFELLLDNPLGLGIGQVGPAAQWLKDSTNQALISENFYLQIGLELGVDKLYC